MATWQEVVDALEGRPPTWFRGQRRPWPVRAKLHRVTQAKLNYQPANFQLDPYRDETRRIAFNLYSTFRAEAWPMLTDRGRWDIVFAMQHHGVATRLIDFTASFAVGVYFALQGREEGDRPTLTMLAPSLLGGGVRAPTELDGLHPCDDPLPPGQALGSVPVVPEHSHPRLSAQQSKFVVAGDFPAPLELEAPQAVSTFELDDDACIEGARFLKLAGVRESSVFPDLQAIGRDAMRGHRLGDYMDV